MHTEQSTGPYPIRTLYGALPVMGGAAATLSLSSFQGSFIPGRDLHAPVSKDGITYLLDPVLLTVLSLLTLCALVRHVWLLDRPGPLGRRYAWVVTAWIASALVSHAWLKPAFLFVERSVWASPTIVVDQFESLHSLGEPAPPSGHVFIQMIMLWIATAQVKTERRLRRVRVSTFALLALMAFLPALSALVAIYRAMQSWFDVGLALICSHFFFVITCYVWAFFNRHSVQNLQSLAVASLLVTSPFFFHYSGSANRLAATVMLCVGILSVPSLWPRGDSTHSPPNQ